MATKGVDTATVPTIHPPSCHFVTDDICASSADMEVSLAHSIGDCPQTVSEAMYVSFIASCSFILNMLADAPPIGMKQRMDANDG